MMSLRKSCFHYEEKEEMTDNIKQIARRLSKARSVALDSAYRRTSGSSQPQDLGRMRRANSQQPLKSDNLLKNESVSSLPDKIADWMLHTEFNAKEKRCVSASSERRTSHRLSTALEYDPFSDGEEHQNVINPENTGLPPQLKKEISRSESSLCDVKWGVKNCDVLIEVEDMLLPIEKNFVSYISETFRTIIEGSSALNNNNEDVVMVLLHNYTFSEVKTVLEHIYCVNEDCVSDGNVASLLQLGEEFRVERLMCQCEKHLRESKTFNPLITSHLAKQYRLDSLLEYAFAELSKIDGIEDTQEFQLLDSVAQNQILKFAVRRYRKAARTLSQFDVHLCSHHGNDAKNNTCCFRAATYSTENNRTFLVQMENPDKKLTHSYQDAFHCNTENLLQKYGEHLNRRKERFFTM